MVPRPGWDREISASAVLTTMRIDLLGHSGDLGAQGGQDRHLSTHGRGVGSSDERWLTQGCSVRSAAWIAVAFSAT